jgi:hypothetical protein
MASSPSRLCSDEELQKARVDLDEFIADEDEFECLSGDEDEEGNNEEGKETPRQKNKKKKKVVVPMETVQTFLNYKCSIPVREHESEHSGDIGTLSRVSNVFTRHFLDRISALQDKLRHEVEAKGYAEYEATDDDDEEEEEEVQEEKHEDTPPASSTNAAMHHSGA